MVSSGIEIRRTKKVKGLVAAITMMVTDYERDGRIPEAVADQQLRNLDQIAKEFKDLQGRLYSVLEDDND